MSYSNVSFVCASHMCPSQYATGLTDGFYLCAVMVLGVSFIEHLVNHVRNRVTYTMEKDVDEDEDEDKDKDVDVDDQPKEESVQEEEKVQEAEKVQDVQELIQKVIKDVQELIQDVQDPPTELEKDVSDDSEVYTPRHKMRRLQV